MACYCVARNKPIRRAKTKLQTTTVIDLWFWGLLAYPELYWDCPGHHQHFWNFSGVHDFVSLTITGCLRNSIFMDMIIQILLWEENLQGIIWEKIPKCNVLAVACWLQRFLKNYALLTIRIGFVYLSFIFLLMQMKSRSFIRSMN